MNEYKITITPTRAPEDAMTLAVDADSTDEALFQARELLNEGLVPTWTTLGFWYNDEPVSVGVVPGEVSIYGGGTVDELGDSSFQGAWATSAQAPDWETAEAFCIAEMESTLDRDDDEDSDDEDSDEDGNTITVVLYGPDGYDDEDDEDGNTLIAGVLYGPDGYEADNPSLHSGDPDAT